jgi:hypothetical protein
MDIVVDTTRNSTTPSSGSAPKKQTADAATADVDEMGEESFPASDPPGVWAWELPPRPPQEITDERGRSASR